MPITVSLDPDAEKYLRTKVTTCYGHGRYLSILLMAEAAREDERKRLAGIRAQELSSQHDWERTGVCVD
jgi:hypothetical protein